jgi:hypothetical protein
MMSRLYAPLAALALILCISMLPASAAAAEGSAAEGTSSAGQNALELWQKDHRWFRLGMRFYGTNPAIDEHAALKTGAAISIPLTTDFFMGIGMRLAFVGGYNAGKDCVERAGGTSSTCPDGHPGGVDYIWRKPMVNGVVDGSNSNATPSPTEFMDPQRRVSHVAAYSLSIGANYELTIPTVKVFRHFQPFFGGGVVIAWVYTYSDITANEFILINNDQNDPWDEDNLDPWSSQGPEVGGEVYGGFHINIKKTFRFTFEVGYHAFDVPAAELNKATEGFEAQHLAYRLSQTRFGGGFEFRF